ncbi:MAG: efflux RND transporter permease subunit, partial [Candidatus Margulisiibacteriota bacterium]
MEPALFLLSFTSTLALTSSFGSASSFGAGAILATLVLFIFLSNFRSLFIIAATIPLSLLFTFSLMFFGKLTLNVMTLSGLALGIGMLLDNSIVVLENIFKKKQELAPVQLNKRIEKDIVIKGANEMLLAITASTITTLVVFLPLVFINPEIRMLYSGIALTITFSLLASLLVSLAFVPMLATKLELKKSSDYRIYKKLRELLSSIKLFFITPSPGVKSNLPPQPLSEKILSTYQNLVNYCLNFRYLVIAIALLSLAVVFHQGRKLEKEFIGIAEQNKFTIFIEMPTGTRLGISDKVVSEVEQIVAESQEIKTFTAKIEPWSSKVYVELKPLNERKISTGEVIDKLRPLTDKVETAFIYYEEPEEVGTKEILLELYGYDYEILKSLAMQVAQKIQPIPKFTDVKIRMREGRPEMHLTINKRRAALFGLSIEDIALNLHTQMRGLVATRYRGTTEPLLRLKEKSLGRPQSYASGEKQKMLQTKSEEFKKLVLPTTDHKEKAKEVETIVRLEEEFRRTFEDLRRINMVTPDGDQVYLSQLADFRFDLGPSEIWRKNKFRMVQVSANTGGMALGTAADNVKMALSDSKFPKDYFWQFGGNYDKMIRNQKELSFALILSLILVYMILASLLESFKQPLIILFSVPLAAIGAIIALRITNKPVGTGVLIGAIMLGGIVVNNSIILIDRINFLRRGVGA